MLLILLTIYLLISNPHYFIYSYLQSKGTNPILGLMFIASSS